MLRAGIVGLPNVGKSTLFNALTATRGAESANYPFSTTGANVGVVNVPDARLEPLAKIARTKKIVYATVEFVDMEIVETRRKVLAVPRNCPRVGAASPYRDSQRTITVSSP